MIPFLIVTAIVNIALGYALAVYLGRANGPTTWREIFPTTFAPEIDGAIFGDQFAMLHNDRLPPIDERLTSTYGTRQSVERTNDDAARSTFTASPVDDEPFAHAEVKEQELLAGIEEFRNQLSQLKGQGVAGILHDTVALDEAR